MHREMTQAPSVLKIEGISKVFNGGSAIERRALTNVSLVLNEGDFAVIIGSNGAGKSTLLGTIAGDVVVETGRITVSGQDLTRVPVHRRASYVARVFQDPSKGTAPGLSVEENLALAFKRGQKRGLSNATGKERRRIFEEALQVLGLGLERRLDTPVDLLSGGQRQALSLTMASLVRPDILVLDEHCAALDPRTAEMVMAATVRTVRAERITTIMVTHNMQHAIDYGNRLIMMHEGRIIYQADDQEKAALTVETLIGRFQTADDKLLLAR